MTRRAAPRFERWLADVAARRGLAPQSLRSASSDASFRRYFRVDGSAAPAARASSSWTRRRRRKTCAPSSPWPSCCTTPAAGAAGARAGRGAGFLLLTDLGSRLYRRAERHRRGDETGRCAMRSALSALVQWQSRADASGLPPYDDALLRANWRSSRLVRDARVRPRLERRPAAGNGTRPAIRWCAARWPSRPWRCTATSCRAT